MYLPQLTKIFLLVVVIIWHNDMSAQILEKDHFTIGETLEIKSEILSENRTINIYLPNGYHPDSVKTYQVIYLFDGSGDEDFIHIAGLVQFCSFSWINIVPESIVVGIGNVDRKKDFTYPSSNKMDNDEFPTSGHSDNFIKFIAEELQPLIDENYKTDDLKTIIGQSLGGLLATEILLNRPYLFDNYIIVSPSLWWDDEKILDVSVPKLNDKSIYIGVGKEGEVMERVAKELHANIEGAGDFDKLFFQFFDNKNHGDALHVAVYDAFEKMFKEKEGEE